MGDGSLRARFHYYILWFVVYLAGEVDRITEHEIVTLVHQTKPKLGNLFSEEAN